MKLTPKQREVIEAMRGGMPLIFLKVWQRYTLNTFFILQGSTVKKLLDLGLIKERVSAAKITYTLTDLGRKIDLG